MKTAITAMLLVFVLQSCNTEMKQPFEKEILGEWGYVKTVDSSKQHKGVPPPPVWKETDGYAFFEDNTCDYNPGFFKRIEAAEREDRKTFYLGSRTKYTIAHDSLRMFDPASKTWVRQKIFSIAGDTLTFKVNDSLFAKYARLKPVNNPDEHYDRIIVSSSGCFGSCPIADVSIDKNGKILFNGEAYNTQNGFFSGTTATEIYRKIEADFKKAGIMKLDDRYSAHWTDDEAVEVTFVKDNKIVKTVSDYGRQSPSAFLWAYTRARYLYQHVKLVPLKKDKSLPIWGVGFKAGNSICPLTKSESFYLLTIIGAGRASSENFKPKYTINYYLGTDKKQTIYTDGRFFRFPDKTIDIGYDFLQANGLLSKFEDIGYD